MNSRLYYKKTIDRNINSDISKYVRLQIVNKIKLHSTVIYPERNNQEDTQLESCHPNFTTREGMYVQHNNEAHSCNHCCSRKAIRMTYFECVL